MLVSTEFFLLSVAPVAEISPKTRAALDTYQSNQVTTALQLPHRKSRHSVPVIESVQEGDEMDYDRQ